MNKVREDISVGDIVMVKNWGRNYSYDNQWFDNHFDELDRNWIINYAYDNSKYDKYSSFKSDPNYYKVLYIGFNAYESVALIGDYLGKTAFGDAYVGAVYLISLDTLDVVEHIKKMTKTEIEKELGYKIEIINESEDKNYE